MNQILTLIAASALFTSMAPCQEAAPAEPVPSSVTAAPSASAGTESKRILWIIPNYKTAPSLNEAEPLTYSAKFRIATEDATDRGTFALAAVLAGIGQLNNSNRSFGQGAAAYGRYLGTAYGDLAIGNYMTEGVFPGLLHQDPRYFRQGNGSGWKRFRYAVGQTFLTHGDSGKTQINLSELMGNATAVAISSAYYADNRTASDAVSKFGMQIGFDMAANVLKEFWPDLHRRFSRKHDHQAASESYTSR